jgi:hypothetical protein
MKQNQTYKGSLVPIDVVCGCTDPEAENYNPDASVDIYTNPNDFQELCGPGAMPACAYLKQDPPWLEDVVPYGETFLEACNYIGGEVTLVNECGADAVGDGTQASRMDPSCEVQVCENSSYMMLLGSDNASTDDPFLVAGLKHSGVVGFDGAGGLVYDLGLQVRLAASRIPPFVSRVVEPQTPKGYMASLALEGYIILGLVGYGIYLANKKGLFK